MSHGSSQQQKPLPLFPSILCGSVAGSVAEVNIKLSRFSLFPWILQKYDCKFKDRKKLKWAQTLSLNIVVCLVQ